MAPISLLELGKIFSDVADAIGKLGDSVAHLVTLGARGWDAGQARATKARLRSLSRAMIGAVQMNGPTIDLLANFSGDMEDLLGRGVDLTQPGLSRELGIRWGKLRERVTVMLHDSALLLGAVERENSDFVLSPAYRDVFAVLASRDALLVGLSALGPPRTTGELADLKALTASYKRLRANLERAVEAIARYVEAAESVSAGNAVVPER